MATRLETRPCLDSEAMAAARRKELDISRGAAARMGAEAVEIAGSGGYRSPSGASVDISAAVAKAVACKVSIPSEVPLHGPRKAAFDTMTTEVSNETTLGAARRLRESGAEPLALNFANGIHPGGGFLSGARAQEEALCRSSALYATLAGDAMYAAHARRPAPDSTDWCILSPAVPVFRADDGSLLEEPWLLSFITCAAPVASRIGEAAAAGLMKKRIARVLEVAAAYGYEALVLGAWGCGAFGNDARETARSFVESLSGPFRGCFKHVVFAVTDWSEERRFLGPFRDAISE
jgi:uncharacterized protein (TIGR02452 family)